jgi:hypothetical protein
MVAKHGTWERHAWRRGVGCHHSDGVRVIEERNGVCSCLGILHGDDASTVNVFAHVQAARNGFEAFFRPVLKKIVILIQRPQWQGSRADQ